MSAVSVLVTVNDVTALNINKKAELDNMCVAISFIEPFSLLILTLTDLSFWGGGATLGVIYIDQKIVWVFDLY